MDDEPVDEALDVGPDGGEAVFPLMLLVGLCVFGAALLLDGNEEGGACDGRADGNPAIGWRSFPGILLGFGDTWC